MTEPTLADIRIFIDPVPASRPRVVPGRGAYYAKPYARFKHAAGVLVAYAYRGPRLSGPLSCVAEFVVRRPKKTKLSHPKPDIDNYLKAALDACNRIVWDDDAQVCGLRDGTCKRWTEPGEEPHIRLVVMRRGER